MEAKRRREGYASHKGTPNPTARSDQNRLTDAVEQAGTQMRSLPRPCRAGASAKPAHNSIVPAPPSNAISLGVHERPEHRGDAVRKAATGAIVDLMSRGKRGTHRRARHMAPRAAQQVGSVRGANFLIGVNTLELDVKRASETICWETRKTYSRPPPLQPGEFVAWGPTYQLARAGRCAPQHHVGGVTALRDRLCRAH